MKKTTNFFGLFLLLSGVANSTHGKINNIFFDDFANFDVLFDDASEKQLVNAGPKKEEREKISAATKALSLIKADVTEDKDNVIITFNLENVDKNAVELEIKETNRYTFMGHYRPISYLQGTISAKEGKVSFAITKDALEISRTIEIKKSEKEKEKQSYSQFISTSSEVNGLPDAVTISPKTVNAQTKNNKLIITIAKNKPEDSKKPSNKIAISHS